ncbi:MAG TPA: NAD-dependent epimerase/dehydratase family protein [Kofleriaceae bacterium]|nr:NAD-dependent epimerase/dehydratase family protein [Kofleriaceae bacterium]
MTLDRRSFLLGSLATGLAASCGSRRDAPPLAGAAAAAAPAPAAAAPPKQKTLLVLGGTGFLGPHVVEAALARGHKVTLFNRGKTRPELFPTVEKLQGDRDGKLEALRGRTWDAVVDTSAYVPRITKLSAELLAPSVKQYVNISTISVYAGHERIGADEAAPLATLPDPASEDVKQHYGALKALCEQAAEAAMPGRVANLRPGLIIGPGDPTGRFTHWPARMAEGGEVLCPGDGATPTQYIDGRDLGAWIVKVVEDGTVGTFNALGPARRITMREVLEACNAAGGNKATLTWVAAAFLEEQEVSPWGELPMWFDAKGEMAGFGTISNARAVAAGLTFRPILETARDTLAWLDSLPESIPEDKRKRMRSAGLSREKEAKVLAAWKARK